MGTAVMKVTVKGYFLFLFLATAFILGSAELLLRVAFHLPEGIFWDWSPADNGLYPANSRIKMLWGPVPYILETNSLGFRGPELSEPAAESKIRIAALGDSVTDGAFVDNNDNYPSALQEILRNMGIDADVIDAAHMGGSIDKEFAIFRRNVMPLHPQIVILTFVTNDIAEIRGKPKEELISGSIEKPETNIANFFLVKTAVGEFIFDAYLKLRYSNYRKTREETRDFSNRYNIQGGDKYSENSLLFNKRFQDTDGLILTEPFSKEVRDHIDNYIYALRGLRDVCAANNIKLHFVYFPAYSQIYDDSASFRIRDILAEASGRLGISFLDLTPVFQDKGKNAVLHMAPLDYHLNPEGNRVMAEAIADYLQSTFLKKTGDSGKVE